MTGAFRLADGTAAVPSFGFNAEASTGLYRAGTNILGFSVGAGEKMRILGTGNVIIGTTSNTGQKFQVTGTAAITGNSTIGGTLGVTGNTTLSALLTANGNINVNAAGRIGYIADTDTATIQGVTSANYGLTAGGSHTGFGGPGVLLAGYNGVILATNATERLRISSTGAVTIGGTLSSSNMSASAGVANRIVLADGSGYIHNTYFNSSDNSATSGVTGVMVKVGDNYLRTGSAAAVQAFLAGTTNANSMTYTGVNDFTSSASTVGNANRLGGLEAYGNGTNSAGMSFHRPGAYAINMGLDNDNHFRIGGWSDGAAVYRAQFYQGGSLRIGGAFYPDNGSNYLNGNSGTYGSLEIGGTKGGYSGIYLPSSSGTTTGMYDTSGNGGDYDTTTAWHFYWHRGNACLGIGGSGTASGYKAQTNGSHYIDGSLAVGGSASTVLGDVTASRAGGTTGVYYFGTNNSKYLYFNGTSFNLSGGSLSCTGDITAYSDRRIKSGIEQITGALDKVEQIRGVTFYRNADPTGKRSTGVIAQEVEVVLPEAVNMEYDSPNDTTGEGLLTVAYGNMVGLLIEAIKELNAEVKALKAKVV